MQCPLVSAPGADVRCVSVSVPTVGPSVAQAPTVSPEAGRAQ